MQICAQLMRLLALALALACCPRCQAKLQVTFSPSPIVVKTETELRLNVSINETQPVPSGTLNFSVRDPRVACLPMENETRIPWAGNSTEQAGPAQLTVRGVRLGWTELFITYTPLANGTGTDSDLLAERKVRIAVLRDQTAIQTVYRVILIVFVILLVIGMGCTIDVKVVLKLVKRPVGLAVGWCAQFILMPHLGVAVGQLLLLLVTDLDNTSAFAFGILTLACSPGGGSSNAWTLLFDGDLDLSMTMTFLSQLCALFMMPLWLFVYSRLYIEVDSVRIPYEQVAYNLLQLVIPVLAGVALKAKWPSVAYKIARFIKPFTVLFVLFVVSFGTYVNFFLFELIAQLPIIIPFAALLPWLGFLFSYIVTQLLRLKRRQSIAIALETGIQNVGIPILVLQFSMPKPDGDLAAIVPLIVVLVTPVPLYFLLCAKKIRDRVRRGHQYALDTKPEADAESSSIPTPVDYYAEVLKSGLAVDMSNIQSVGSTQQLGSSQTSNCS